MQQSFVSPNPAQPEASIILAKDHTDKGGQKTLKVCVCLCESVAKKNFDLLNSSVNLLHDLFFSQCRIDLAYELFIGKML